MLTNLHADEPGVLRSSGTGLIVYDCMDDSRPFAVRHRG